MEEKTLFADDVIYHVTARAINKSILFHEESDYYCYLAILKKSKSTFGVKVLSYVLMDNHVHQILKGKSKNISKFMNSVLSKYARYYNKKYERIGHVFNERFGRERIYEEQYLYNCIRYIHQNPVKASICKFTYQYKFSSTHAFRNSKKNFNKIVDLDEMTDYIENVNFKSWNEEKNNYHFLEARPNKTTDKYVEELLLEVANVKNLSEYELLDEIKQNIAIKHILDDGYPISQLIRLTGKSKRKIYDIKNGILGRKINTTYF